MAPPGVETKSIVLYHDWQGKLKQKQLVKFTFYPDDEKPFTVIV